MPSTVGHTHTEQQILGNTIAAVVQGDEFVYDGVCDVRNPFYECNNVDLPTTSIQRRGALLTHVRTSAVWLRD